MAAIIVWFVIGSLGSLALMQTIYVGLYWQLLNSNRRTGNSERFTPSVAVMLCLRGADPSLTECLSGLVGLDYPDYEIHLVFDHKTDPALPIVDSFFEGLDSPAANRQHPHIHILREPAGTGSLKCSALVSAIAELNPGVDVVALIDADTVADSNWLSDLVQPLANSQVGATTGNRWFAPTTTNPGSLVRQSWNAAAVVQMSLYKIPWGGTLALKRSTIEQANLLDAWRGAFCEDTMLTGILKSHQLKVVRVPHLIVANDEATSLKNAFRWISRQLLTARLYHRDWKLVLTHALYSGFCLVMAIFSLVVLLAVGKPWLAMTVLSSLLVFELINAVLLLGIRSSNEKILQNRDPGFRPMRAGLIHSGMAIVLTQFLHPLAAISAATARQVRWRGIHYRIGPGNKISMDSYQPYQIPASRKENDAATESID